jgi:hypothetical protein
MLGAFAIGVFLASRSHPFSPSVVGPTAGPTASVTASEGQRWRGTMTSSTSQAFREGTCTTDWKSKLEFVAFPDGTVRGAGHSALKGTPKCFFASVQVQTRAFDFQIHGLVDAGTLHLGLRDFVGSPSPSFDQGGFYLTIASVDPTLDLDLAGGGAQGNVVLTRTVNALPSRSRNRIELAERG